MSAQHYWRVQFGLTTVMILQKGTLLVIDVFEMGCHKTKLRLRANSDLKWTLLECPYIGIQS